MSLDTAQTTVTEVQNDVAPTVAEQFNPKPVTERALNFSNLLEHRIAMLPSRVTEQAFQSLRRIAETNSAVTQALCDMALRQQNFMLTSAQTTLAGLPDVTARHADITLASIQETYIQNLRMLGRCTSVLLKMSSLAAAETQPSATS